MRTKFLATAAVLACGMGTAVHAQERVSIATGGTSGLFYIIGAGIADQINAHMPDTTARAEVTGASVENIRRVAADQMTFGLSSASTLFDATKGEGPFKDGVQNVSGMAYLYPAVLQVATVKSTGIDDFGDLAGKRINLGPPGSNSAVLGQRIMEAHGVFDPNKVQFLSYSEGVAALTNGTIDATVVLAGAPTAALIDLDAQKDMVLLSLDKEAAESLTREYPYYQTYEIAPGTYSDISEPVTAINDPATLFTKADADPAKIQGLMSAIFDHLDELAQVHPQAKAITLEAAPEMAVPLHPGAQAYFASK
ncbi:TAXI family TRAP transporter solute-binding subunit [Paracoccus sp. MBLB3053]|uniref:TAXI family TRAP transporter solute-binding subunit n=1 Tax=Paracoccus aurantius TaxID=3073814 RepID=A0ABU2HXU0_9RHOB|nr:TAXI family TRAP transporter solute-binding subunit [Paracoccus sp. MBLB3053]MDS9469836.1 TAXI family TRAP transporter solute-binding subunit [Paracoccus sp. MBLB3053]